jgi:hypothetical protein
VNRCTPRSPCKSRPARQPCASNDRARHYSRRPVEPYGQRPGVNAAERRCRSLNRHGERCAAKVVNGRGYCVAHDPERPADMRELGKLSAKARSRPDPSRVNEGLRSYLRREAEPARVWEAIQRALDGGKRVSPGRRQQAPAGRALRARRRLPPSRSSPASSSRACAPSSLATWSTRPPSPRLRPASSTPASGRASLSCRADPLPLLRSLF